jgi:tyrosyl-tRNA synthetase
MKNLIEELQWRGLIQDIIPETEDLLMKEKVSGYIGFDPTSDSLHIGSLVPIILLMHLQRAGHKPYALIGGATGMVGDPSGKSAERNMLSMEQINLNVQGVKKQLSKFLDFDSNAENAAVLVNNIDWFNDFTFLDFIRDVGKYITVNYMMSKDSVKKRLETGMSFTEFTYQLVQGYDFYHLYKTYGIKLQMGGSDQWGNIVTGTELIRKKIQGEAFAFTAPLIKKADGGKFGKTESGNVWLDSSKTSPYSFYQFWLNTTDDDAGKYIKIFTFLPKKEIDEIIAIHNNALHLRSLQKRLAQELTCMVHSEKDFEFAVEASKILFGDDTSEALKSLNENELVDIMDGVPRFEVAKIEFDNGISIIDLLVNTSILPSKSEAKKMIQSNAISLNKIKNGDVNASINTSFLLNDKYLLVQKGKKNYYLIQAL